MATIEDIAAIRKFLRSLQITLKLTQLYGATHLRPSEQLESAWADLQSILSRVSEEKERILIESQGAQLVLNGVQVSKTPAEHSLSETLQGAGIASVQLLPSITREEFAGFLQTLSSGMVQVGNGGVRVQRVTEAAGHEPYRKRVKGRGEATRPSPKVHELRVYKAFIAQETPKNGTAAEQNDGPPSVSASFDGRVPDIPKGASNSDAEILSALQLLARVGQTSADQGEPRAGLEALRQELEKIHGRTRQLVQQALATLAAQTLTLRSNDPVLLRLAEHLALRYAIDRSERGRSTLEMRRLLDRMSEEIKPLQKLSHMDGRKKAQMAIGVEIPTDLLDRQFWSAMSQEKLQAVLASTEGWCVHPRNIRRQVEEMVRAGTSGASELLDHYTRFVNHPETEARRRAAAGLAEIADLYAASEDRPLIAAIRCTGAQLNIERDKEAQELLGRAFLKLADQACTHRRYRAVVRLLDLLDNAEGQQRASAPSLPERLGIGKHQAVFVEEAIRTVPSYPGGLIELLGRAPRSTAEELTLRFNRCVQRDHSERILAVANATGGSVAASLREILQTGTPAEAGETVGLLSRLDTTAVREYLGARVARWPRQTQDRVVRLLGASDAPERGGLLLAIYEQVDPMLLPLAVDEIAMSGDPSAVEPFLRLAAGALPKGTGDFLRLKAIEGLGRLHATEAADLLRGIAAGRKLWGWLHPAELRIAALQALQSIVPEWVREFLPRSGLSPADLAYGAQEITQDSQWFRQRRYARARFSTTLAATATSDHRTIALEIHSLSLSGGLASSHKPLTPGTQVVLRLGTGLRAIRTRAVLRGSRAQTLSFEFSGMELEERARLRRLIHEHALPPAAPRPAAQSGTLATGTAS